MKLQYEKVIQLKHENYQYITSIEELIANMNSLKISDNLVAFERKVVAAHDQLLAS